MKKKLWKIVNGGKLLKILNNALILSVFMAVAHPDCPGFKGC